jgi:prepilin-type N-terminal cleavage/methylation domain-containing protein
MSRFIQKQGFTLIELMVVIVIIGVLASLAIPRFSEASSKAKMAEAPRVLASFESAYLAAVAEKGKVESVDDLVFDLPSSKESKWWKYSGNGQGATGKAEGKLGKFKKDGYLSTKYVAAADEEGTGDDKTDAASEGFDHGSDDCPSATKMVPNFFKEDCNTSIGTFGVAAGGDGD